MLNCYFKFYLFEEVVWVIVAVIAFKARASHIWTNWAKVTCYLAVQDTYTFPASDLAFIFQNCIPKFLKFECQVC